MYLMTSHSKALRNFLFVLLFAVALATLVVPAHFSLAQQFSYEAPGFDISLNVWTLNTPQDRLTVSLTSTGGGSSIGLSSVEYSSCPSPSARVIVDSYYMENTGAVELRNNVNTAGIDADGVGGVDSQTMTLTQQSSGTTGTCGVAIGSKGTFGVYNHGTDTV